MKKIHARVFKQEWARLLGVVPAEDHASALEQLGEYGQELMGPTRTNQLLYNPGKHLSLYQDGTDLSKFFWQLTQHKYKELFNQDSTDVLFLRIDFLATEFFRDGHQKKSGHVHV